MRTAAQSGWGHIAEQECPQCGTTFSANDGWAKRAASILFMIRPAVAVHDMATQVRFPQCQHLSAESAGRYRRASWPPGWVAALGLRGVALLAWAVYQLFWAYPGARAR